LEAAAEIAGERREEREIVEGEEADGAHGPAATDPDALGATARPQPGDPDPESTTSDSTTTPNPRERHPTRRQTSTERLDSAVERVRAALTPLGGSWAKRAATTTTSKKFKNQLEESPESEAAIAAAAKARLPRPLSLLDEGSEAQPSTSRRLSRQPPPPYPASPTASESSVASTQGTLQSLRQRLPGLRRSPSEEKSPPPTPLGFLSHHNTPSKLSGLRQHKICEKCGKEFATRRASKKLCPKCISPTRARTKSGAGVRSRSPSTEDRAPEPGTAT
jgi:hypothetical protein